MAQVPSGTLMFVASSIASAKAVAAVSNAAEAVVSSTAHGYSVGDIVMIYSGWGRLNKRAFRIKTVTTDSFVLEGADTTNTNFYPTGGGAGTVAKVVTWTQFTTVMNPSTSGGDPKNVTYKFLESDTEYNINDGFSAITRSYDLDADSIGTPGYNALKALTDVQSDTVLKMLLRSGSAIYLPCTVTLNEEVILSDGKINSVKLAVSGNGRSTRYAA